MLAASILAALLVITLYLPALFNMGGARQAYYENDYKTAFLTMYGKDLNDSDRLIYQRSRVIVLLDRKYESYENYMRMGMPREALDALLQGVKRYDEIKDSAAELGVEEQVNEVWTKILAALSAEYGITEQEAHEILAYSPVDYTRRIDAAVNGTPFRRLQEEVYEEYNISLQPEPEQPEPEQPENETVEEPEETPSYMDLPDLLPTEEEHLREMEQGGENLEPDAQEQPAPEEPQEPAAEEHTQPVGDAATNNGDNVTIQIDSEQF